MYHSEEAENQYLLNPKRLVSANEAEALQQLQQQGGAATGAPGP